MGWRPMAQTLSRPARAAQHVKEDHHHGMLTVDDIYRKKAEMTISNWS